MDFDMKGKIFFLFFFLFLFPFPKEITFLGELQNQKDRNGLSWAIGRRRLCKPKVRYKKTSIYKWKSKTIKKRKGWCASGEGTEERGARKARKMWFIVLSVMNEWTFVQSKSEQKKTALVEESRDVMQRRVSQSATDGVERCQYFHRPGFGGDAPACQSLQQLLLRALPKWASYLTLAYRARTVVSKRQAHKVLPGQGGLNKCEYFKVETQHCYGVHLQNREKNIPCAQLISNLWYLSIWLVNLYFFLQLCLVLFLGGMYSCSGKRN